MTTTTINNAVATLIALREEERENLEAVACIEKLLTKLNAGIETEEEVDACLGELLYFEQLTSVQNTAPWAVDDIVCPWEHEVLDIHETLMDIKREILGGEIVLATKVSEPFGPEILDEDIPF